MARSLYVANARGRGAGPNLVGESRSPKFSVLGTVNIIPTPASGQLDALSPRASTPTTASPDPTDDAIRGTDDRTRRQSDPEPRRDRRAPRSSTSSSSTRRTRRTICCSATSRRPARGVPVNGEPAFSLGFDASPESPRAGAAFRLQRQLLPRAVGVVRRPPLADRPVHRPSSKRPTGRPPTAASAATPATIPTVIKDYPGPHRIHRRQRVARAERLQRARRHLPPPGPPR